MSVRRLAPPELQPKEFSFSKDNLDWAKKQIAKYPEGRQRSAIIPLLWRAQEQVGGWLPEVAIRYVADFLGIAHIRALEVATFYTMFNLTPVGKVHVQLCGTTPCRLRGADDLEKVCRKRMGEQMRSDRGRQVLLGRGRVPGRLRQRADGADRLRLLRGPDGGELREDSRRNSPPARRPSPARRSTGSSPSRWAGRPRSPIHRSTRRPDGPNGIDACSLTRTASSAISTAATTGA